MKWTGVLTDDDLDISRCTFGSTSFNSLSDLCASVLKEAVVGLLIKQVILYLLEQNLLMQWILILSCHMCMIS